jgi:hypothetical protein
MTGMAPLMSREDFEQARGFIERDIGRELELARATKTSLESVGVTPGGGNVLSALGLVCYTEFAGKLKYGKKRKDGKDWSSENFRLFFRDLGPAYAEVAEKCEIYDVLRCGLAHEYFVKRPCDINMFGDVPAGVELHDDGKVVVTVEKYFKDLMVQLEELGRRLFLQRGTSA